MRPDALGYNLIRQHLFSMRWDAPECTWNQCAPACCMHKHSTRSTRIAVEAASLEVAVQVPIEMSQVGGASTLKFTRI